jgi:hypothetical protein
MHEMLHDLNINWADLSPQFKNGIFITKTNSNPDGNNWESKDDVIFTENRNSVEQYLTRKD